MKICVILARGGSKRVPRKNIRAFAGKPMIAHSIAAAAESEVFDEIVVSTDNDEIAEVALEYGASVPFVRPSKLADDYAGTTEVVAHAVKWALEQGWHLDAACCLYATAPFTRPTEIASALELLLAANWDYVFTATEYPSTIFRAFTARADGSVEMFFPDKFSSRSQDLPITLHDAAQFYWGRPRAWLEERSLFGPTSRAYVVPRWRVQDIDTENDWIRAELIWRALEK